MKPLKLSLWIVPAILGGILLWVTAGKRDAVNDGSNSHPVPAAVAVRGAPGTQPRDGDKVQSDSGKPAERVITQQPRPREPDEIDEILSLVRAGNAPEKRLRRALFRLGDSPDPRALEALREAAAGTDPHLRAMAAMVLGRCQFGDVAVTPVLRSLLNDPAPQVVSMAIRALGRRDVKALRQWGLPAIETDRLSPTVAAELIVALAAHGDEAAIDIAFTAAVDASDAEFLSAMLRRVGDLSPDVSIPLAQALIDTENASPELRAEAFHVLADIDTPEAAARLLGYVDPTHTEVIRRQAARAFSVMVDAPVPSAWLEHALNNEPDAEVRVHLYDAILSIEDADPEGLLPLIQREPQHEARIMALFAAGTMCGTGRANAEMERFFETTAVAELEETARNQTRHADMRLRAVSALRNAATASALLALERLAESQDPLVRTAAARPLPPRRR